MSGTVTTTTEARELARHPEQMAPALREARSMVEAAALLHRWPEMDAAIKVYMQRWRDIIAWWDENVRPAGRRREANSCEQTLFSAAQATEQCGLRQDQISRARLVITDPDSYYAKLRDQVLRAAKLRRRDAPAQRPTPRRDGPDFWPTPDSLINALVTSVLPLLPPNVVVWEPAAGDGRLARAIAATHRHDVAVSDLYHDDPDIVPRDYLTTTPPAPCVVITNPPFSLMDEFIARGVELMQARLILGFVLLLRRDHLQAANRVDALNAASFEVHCNWRPVWRQENPTGNPRWSFTWVGWGLGHRRPPLYLRESEGEADERDQVRRETGATRTNGAAAHADAEAGGLFDMVEGGDGGDAADDWLTAGAIGGHG